MAEDVSLAAPQLPAALLGQMLVQAVSQAIEAGLIAELLQRDSKVEELAAVLKLDYDTSLRLLRTLACAGLCRVDLDSQRVRLSSAGRALLDDGEQSTFRQIFDLMMSPDVSAAWSCIGRSATQDSGQTPWEIAHGVSWIDTYRSSPAAARKFALAMTEQTRMLAPFLVREVEFRPAETLCDVGGGSGALLFALAESNPSVSGAVLDIEEMRDSFQEQGKAHDPAAKVTFHAGSFLDHVPEGFDTFILKWILHDWDDATAVQILTRIRAGMRGDSRLLVIERALPHDAFETPGPESLRWCLNDLHMLAVTGGRERTVTEFQRLADAAGLRIEQVKPLRDPMEHSVLLLRLSDQ